MIKKRLKNTLNMLPVPARWLNDLRKVVVSYYKTFGSIPNLIAPSSFNEKVAFRKLFDRRSIFATMANKLDSKIYIREVLGRDYVPKTLKIYNKSSEFRASDVTDKCVLKSDNGWGDILILEPDKFDEINVIRNIDEMFSNRHGKGTAQWAYFRENSRVFMEEFIGKQKLATDYKFYMSYGEVKHVLVILGRHDSENKVKLRFDKNGVRFSEEGIGGNIGQGETIEEMIGPEAMNEMFRIASKLSEGVDFIRVDMYLDGDRVLVGELTVYPLSGLYGKLPEHFDDDTFWPLDRSVRAAWKSVFKPTWGF